LAEGERHELTVEGRSYGAVVNAVLPELDPATRTRTVVFELDDTAAYEVVSGQVVRLDIAETISATGYWLPTAALSHGNRGLWSVLAVESDEAGNGTVARRDVEVLRTDDERVLVRGTLRPKDRIVTGGAHRVVPGQKVLCDA
jgi:hypothetical protein